MKRQTEKPSPTNVSAEKALLGAILLDNRLFVVAGAIEPDDFSLDSHRLLCRTLPSWWAGESGGRGDAGRGYADSQDAGQGGRLAGFLYRIAFRRHEPLPARRERLGADYQAKSLQRRLITLCTEAIEKSYEGSGAGI